ncbi:MAG: EthD family reductase [Rhodothermaceae bacterium]|nr:EthD family reductase [Rhodothermaceae bacterium]
MKNLRLAGLSLVLFTVMFAGCTATGQQRSTAEAMEAQNEAGVTLMVMYPQPTDAVQFDKDYIAHLELLHEKAGIPDDAPLPYTVTKFFPTPDGPAAYYQVFAMLFPSQEALQQAMSTPGMQEVAADAARISTGGGPVVLVGSQNP